MKFYFYLILEKLNKELLVLHNCAILKVGV